VWLAGEGPLLRRISFGRSLFTSASCWSMRAPWYVAMVFASIACGPSAAPSTHPIEIIAHRGVHPFYYGEHDIDRGSGCSATLLHEVEPALIENTLPSIAAAFALGATMIEIDVHRTRDSQLVVFHDAGLECRTNGHGPPERHTLRELRELDAGYGYTADGKSFPLRGRGVGLIPTLREVLDRFPNGGFILDDKAHNVRLIGELLSSYPPDRQHNIVYWGDATRYDTLRNRAAAIGGRLMTREDMMACRRALVRRLGLGALPAKCHGGILIIPADALRPWYARLGLGWPDRFLVKVRAAGSRIFVSTDSPSEAIALGHLAIDGLLTDRIQEVGPALRAATDIRVKPTVQPNERALPSARALEAAGSLRSPAAVFIPLRSRSATR
jgi:glycerophosphoryl diester phosphodiesterase